LALAAACGAPPPGATFRVHGAEVFVDSRAPFAASDDLPERVTSTMAVALAYWGGDWRAIDGLILTLTDEPTVACGTRKALGCTQGDEMQVVTSDPGAGTFACVEQTVLVHEIGHAVIGDPSHTDPRWMGFDFVAEALGGRVGYGADGAMDCAIHPSVWRHPLDER
jgi:hypothetical protein